jgi:hypothetical protein
MKGDRKKAMAIEERYPIQFQRTLCVTAGVSDRCLSFTQDENP